MYLIAKGIAAGFSTAAPVGPIGLLCIQQTLKGGIRLGIASGLGAATADMMYGVLVALGLGASQALLLRFNTILTIFGGLFLCYLGVRKFFSSPSFGHSKAIKGGLLHAYAITFFLTLTNPATILDFTALFMGLNIDFSGYLKPLSFVSGVFIGSALWWFLLCFTVGIFRKKVSTRMLHYINYGAGVVMLSFGIYILSKLWI